MARNNNHNNTINIKNRKAIFDYEIIETFTAGVVLTGTEIKSIRQGKCGLTDTYCMVINGEVWVKNMYIAEYSFGSYNNHTTHRDRKLLLNRKEIRRIAKDILQPGFAIVPLRLFINERGLATSPSPAVNANSTSASPSRNAKTSAPSTACSSSNPRLLVVIGIGEDATLRFLFN